MPTLMFIAEIAHLKAELANRDKKIEQLRESLADIREIWAGSECGHPVHAQEAYAIRLCKQQYKIACEALHPDED